MRIFFVLLVFLGHVVAQAPSKLSFVAIRHLKIDVYRGPQTAVSGLRFVVCGMPPSCIKNRVITIMCFHAAILDFIVVQQLSFKPCKKQNFCLLNIKIHMKWKKKVFSVYQCQAYVGSQNIHANKSWRKWLTRKPTSCRRKRGKFPVNARLKSGHVTCRGLQSAVNVDL